jgi:thiamine pyrophosphate-dependent acetolactate synthase large subunit-like protein
MTAMPTGAQTIVAELEAAGVELAFGLPGVHNLALWDALRASRIRLVGVRHVLAAAYAADGYARATGRLGVALTTTGPGAANTLGAVGEAWASRSPILVVATDIPTTVRRPGVYRGALHETTDQAGMFAPVVVGSRVVRGAGEPAAATRAAITGALRGRGPAYLEVPTDLLQSEATPEPAGPDGAVRPGPPPAGDDVYALVDRAERPLIWAGGGARDRTGEVAALAERLAAPVLTTYGGRGVLPPGHPCCVGMPPHAAPAGRLWDEADLVISFGSDLDGVNTQNWLQPQPPHLVAVNVDAEDAAKNYRADAVVSGLDPDRLRDRGGLDDVAARLRTVRAETCRALDPTALRFLDAVSYALPDDALVVCDMCVPGYWIAAFHGFRRPRLLQFPIGWGTLGFAFPAALGASLAGAGPTVAITGDGGFLFACGELATMAQEAIPLTVVIVDDGGYGMLRYDQALAGAEPYGVDLHTPDFAALAQSFGVRAESVDGLDDDFGEALSRHLADDVPSVLVARAPGLVPPPTTSPNWYRKNA